MNPWVCWTYKLLFLSLSNKQRPKEGVDRCETIFCNCLFVSLFSWSLLFFVFKSRWLKGHHLASWYPVCELCGTIVLVWGHRVQKMCGLWSIVCSWHWSLKWKVTLSKVKTRHIYLSFSQKVPVQIPWRWNQEMDVKEKVVLKHVYQQSLCRA